MKVSIVVIVALVGMFVLQTESASIKKGSLHLRFVNYENDEQLFETDVQSTILVGKLREMVAFRLDLSLDKVTILTKDNIVMIDDNYLSGYNVKDTVKVMFPSEHDRKYTQNYKFIRFGNDEKFLFEMDILPTMEVSDLKDKVVKRLGLADKSSCVLINQDNVVMVDSRTLEDYNAKDVIKVMYNSQKQRQRKVVVEESQHLSFIEFSDESHLFDMDVSSTILISDLREQVAQKLQTSARKVSLLTKENIAMVNLGTLGDYNVVDGIVKVIHDA